MHTVNLEDLNRKSEKVGPKSAYLGELLKKKFPVPSGFVLTTDALEHFLKYNNLRGKIDSLLSEADTEDPVSLQRTSSSIQNLILNGDIPKKTREELEEAYEELSVGKAVKRVGGAALDLVKAGRETSVVLRSSPLENSSYSFAGLMQAEMNVRGNRSIKNSLKKCWASLYSPQVLFYRETRGIEHPPLMGVLVQRMMHPEKSGTLFSTDPLSSDENKIIVEGHFGLGEPVSSGLITPDTYILDRSGELLEKKVPSKPWYKTVDRSTGESLREKLPESRSKERVLSDSELKELLQMAQKVQGVFDSPQGIEWCRQRGKFFLLQSRPITTLGRRVSSTSLRNQEREATISGTPASPGLSRGKARLVYSQEDLQSLVDGEILVSKNLTREMLPYLRKTSAVITGEGCITSNPAIIMRELEIPFIVSAGKPMTRLSTGVQLTLDAINGDIYSESTPSEAEPDTETESKFRPESLEDRLTATKIKLSLSSPEFPEELKNRSDGVGFFTLEDIRNYTRETSFPGDRENITQLINNGILKTARFFHPKPVYYLPLEPRSSEAPVETEIARTEDRSRVLRHQFRVLNQLQDMGLDNLHLILPSPSSLEEFRKMKQLVDFHRVGIKIDTPATALIMQELSLEGIEFSLLDLDKLHQHLLGESEKVPADWITPALSRLIETVSRPCRKAVVEVLATGKFIASPRITGRLIELGVDSLCVRPEELEKARIAAAKAERKILLDKLRER